MIYVRCTAVAALLVVAATGVVLGISALNTSDGAPTTPQPSPSVPHGLSVERVRVGDRDLWCDGTREVS